MSLFDNFYQGPKSGMWNAADVVQDITVAARAAEVLEYRQDLMYRSAMYDGEFEFYSAKIDSVLSGMFESWQAGINIIKSHWPRDNWTRRIVNTISRAYQDVNPRNVETEDQDIQTQCTEMLDDLDWLSNFKSFERQSNLLGSGIIEIAGNGWSGRPELRWHSLAHVWVREHPNYPNNIDACLGIAMEIPRTDNMYTAATPTGSSRYIRYLPSMDPETGERMGWRCDMTDVRGKILHTYAGPDGTGRGLDMPYMPILPLVKADAEKSDVFYPDHGEDFFNNIILLDMKTAELGAGMFYSTHPLLVATGFSSDEALNIRVGPNSLAAAHDPTASLAYLEVNAGNFKSISEINDIEFKKFLVSESIPPTEMDSAAQGNLSGKAIFAARQSLYERRNDTIGIRADIERRVWQKLTQFNQWWFININAVPEDMMIERPSWGDVDWTQYNLHITFPSPSPLMSADEIDQLWSARINAGMYTLRDYYIEVRGMSPEAADMALTAQSGAVEPIANTDTPSDPNANPV